MKDFKLIGIILGWLLATSIHAAELSKLHGACVRGIGRAGRVAQLVRSLGPRCPGVDLSLA